MSDAAPTPAPSGDRESPSDETFVLSYDGAEYQGEMDARQLADVLTNLDTLVTRVLVDTTPEVHGELKVRAFRHGSFTILAAIATLRAAGIGVGTVTTIGAAFRFYWKNMRRVVKDYEYIPERAVFKVTWLDGEVNELTEEQWRLLNDKRAKKAMRGIAKPLTQGATRMELTAGNEHVTVPASDAAMFELPDDPEHDEIRVDDVWVQPETISFDATRKWRLTNQDIGSFSAEIEDDGFKASVSSGATSIRSNDAFRIRLRTEEVSGADGRVLHRRFVERVLEHHEGRAGDQDALPFDE